MQSDWSEPRTICRCVAPRTGVGGVSRHGTPSRIIRPMPSPSSGQSPAQFVEKWQRVDLPERAASQEHFIDLCRLLGQPTPAEHDATGAEYAFEKGVDVSGSASKGSKGERGFADVWWKGKFGWEYKRKDKYATLDEAYRQLLQYREALESPPLLIVSDIGRTEIHTNFTGTKKEVHSILLKDMAEPKSLALLRRAFTDPESFRPKITTEAITQEVAAKLGQVAEGLRKRGHDPHDTAHFLMKCMFCLFAEDVNLLPKKLFTSLLEKMHHRAKELTPRLTSLFAAMRSGGAYGSDDIEYFNGGLFDTKPALDLTTDEIGLLQLAGTQDWGSVEPAIFGTLFERSLDPAKRSQIGAHYTSREDILLVVEPVIMDPLRGEWAAVKEKVEALLKKRAPLVQAARTDKTKRPQLTKIGKDMEAAIEGFLDRLSKVTILDPACGSGNFLYVAIQRLLDLEKEVTNFAGRRELGFTFLRRVRPTQLHGIEINPYAAELAQVVIWIGYLQWMRDNGFQPPRNPILENLSTIENRDAILMTGKNGEPLAKAASWPEADYIIGNPPFLGSKVFRQNGLDEATIQAIFGAYDLPKTSDLCCYWFELARRAIEKKPTVRAGLLATQGIRGGDNRTVLERIKKSGDIFMAWSDREWLLDGATVRVSIVGFNAKGRPQDRRTLNGAVAAEINADLSTASDVSASRPLAQNHGIAFVGACKKGSFELDLSTATKMLRSSGNPNGRPNADVLVGWLNGEDLVRRYGGDWIVDFGESEDMIVASGYEEPFRYVRELVKPERDAVRNPSEKRRWWMLARPAPDMRRAIAALPRFIGVPQVAKHRVFAWINRGMRPSHQVTVIARPDDYAFGVLSSGVHVLWSLEMGTQLESRPRYTPTTCFETFPLPWAPGKEPVKDPLYKAIAEAAKDLDAQRERWLNPPEWLSPIEKRIDAADDFSDVPKEARPLIRQSAIMAAAALDPKLKKRTLTNLYNERPTWLQLAHERLDRVTIAAYASVDKKGHWSEDWAKTWTESGAGQPLPKGHALTKQRAEVEEKVLGNLLRMNGERAR